MVGGGPAGAVTAALLASWGHDVVLVVGRRTGRPLSESIPPSCRKVLAVVGLLDQVENAGFLSAGGNSSLWAGRFHVAPFEGPAGWQVQRDVLDRLLVAAAARAGARVLHHASVQRILDAPEGGSRASLNLGGVGHSIQAAWVVDASGRAGLLGARAGRTATAPETLAIASHWTRPNGWSVEDPTHTLVESYEDGWIWSIPVTRDVRCVAAMVDPAETRAGGSLDLGRRLRKELAATRWHRSLLEASEPVGRPWACSATPYASARYAGPGWILVGDAGSFLDPLSSFGVRKALSSAWLGAVATHTALRTPSMTAAALELHDGCERDAARQCARAVARFDRDAAAEHAGEFWTRRAALSSVLEPTDPRTNWSVIASDPKAVLDEPPVRAAFGRLRDASVVLRPGRGAARVRRPTVRGREVVLEERIASRLLPEGVARVSGVDVLALIGAAENGAAASSLFAAHDRMGHAVTLPDFLVGTSILLATGLLEIAERGAGIAVGA